jgi:hypothetical protein
MQCACLRTAGCPFAERKVLTTPTGGASSNFAPEGVESPLAHPRHPGRADTLKRRRKVRDEILGRDRRLSQPPSRKGRRLTLYSCLVRPASRVDASLQNELLAPVSRASSSAQDEKTEIIQSTFGVRPLDFRDHIAVSPCQSSNLYSSARSALFTTSDCPLAADWTPPVFCQMMPPKIATGIVRANSTRTGQCAPGSFIMSKSGSNNDWSGLPFRTRENTTSSAMRPTMREFVQPVFLPSRAAA